MGQVCRQAARLCHSFIGGLRPGRGPVPQAPSPEAHPSRDPQGSRTVSPGSPGLGPGRTQEYSRVNLAWNWLSFSKRDRSLSMGGRMVILKGGEK